MEITYNTGAKVILQGPAIYQVETNGGLLSLGRLVGKLEKKVASGQRPGRVASGSPNTDPASSLTTSHWPLTTSFAIHTPTATVTDLGTEFGVEVTDDQATRTQVFHGRIVVKATGPAEALRGTAHNVELGEGEFADVTARGVLTRHTGVPENTTARAIAFVRAIPSLAPRSKQISYQWKTGSPGTFSAEKGDLINAGQATLAKIELFAGSAKFGSSIGVLNDGDLYHGEYAGSSAYSFVPSDGTRVLITLDTVRHPQGYNIDSIVSITGSLQRRSAQCYDVAYSTVQKPSVFVPLRCDYFSTVNHDADGADEAKATLTSGNDMPIASGVAKLRFVFRDCRPSPHRESMYREIDVFGSPIGARNGP
jgi:hypothetical protein